MANLTTVTRPYAKAILEVAHDTDGYANWSKMLEFLSIVVNYPPVNAYVRNLAVTADDKARFINSIDPHILDQQGQNLVKLLAHYKRLLIIPELYKLYEEMRKVQEREITVRLVLAKEVAQNELEKLRTDFSRELNATLTLKSNVDPKLIGGGQVIIGDRVLDASIQGSLKALYQHLTQ